MRDSSNPGPLGPRSLSVAGEPADPRAGTILLVVLFVAMAVGGFLFVGGIVLASYRTQAETEFRAGGQARHVARAGLIDAFSWFRRQPSQPVTTFAPARDPKADPPILDTEDPSIGLVRTIKISGDLYGRYEVRKSDPKNPELQARDVSLKRGLPGLGQAWYLPAWGVIFRRLDKSKPYNQRPNQILGTARAYTEIRRMTLSPPGQAAINARRGDQVTLKPRSRVQGNDGAGIAYPLGTGDPTVQGEVSGHPALAPLDAFDSSPEAVFGVAYAQLKSLADDVIADPNDFPSPVPRESLIVMEGDITFDDTRPLRGTAVVFVNGNVTVGAAPQNFFTGLLYVAGNLTLLAPSLLRGTVICNGQVVLDGTGDYAQIDFDAKVISSLMLSMGQYRISKAMRFDTGPRTSRAVKR